MCGFVGLVRDPALGPVTKEELAALLPDLRHRGPDGSGVVVGNGVGLAATRLRIQGDRRGDQPVVTADGRLAVAFNGELFGPQQGALRRRLRELGARCPDESAGDTALLAAGFSAALAADGSLAGPSALEVWKSVGRAMGALAVVELDQGIAWVGQDRFGIKPLYLSGAVERDGEIGFASTMLPLLRMQAARAGVRLRQSGGLAHLWHFQAAWPGQPFESIDHGFAGERMRIALTGPPDLQAIATEEETDEEAPAEAAQARLSAALAESSRLAADVDGPVSLFLSGGIDSAAVAALAGRADLLALTGRFGPLGGALDESEGACATARALALRHEVHDLNDRDLVEDLEGVIRALELPIAGPGSLALWALARHAAQRGRVVLTGTGGDELLGGYARVPIALGRAGPWTVGYEGLDARLPRDVSAWRRHHESLDRRADLAPLFEPGFRERLTAMDWYASDVTEPDMDTFGGSALDWILEAERSVTLPMLLHVEDRVLMAHGVEGRPVFCLGDVPDAALALPEEQLIGPDGEGKVALRAILKGRIPESVRMDKRKRGFPTPFGRAARGAGRERAEALLGDRRFRERGWWDVKACRALLDDEERPPHDRALFALLSWETWARLFVDGDAWRSPAQALPVPSTDSGPTAQGAPGR